ncbi:DUF4367 domain-containing protein [Halobacillus salinus]|uniref:DUF4367 domain-containing protein n=1 Tax=Halobacillus salinus TaxID=192814 RepID=A0A4Z0H1F6_9BACI|nr:DUF4367 domain-containing protein [Halobacillus salinus]TGB03687.1 DUF4367 domain-containing protein [Halobacillus salinus]
MIKKILFSALILLLVVGCSSNQSSGDDAAAESTPKEGVTTVLEQMLTGPDEELMELYDGNDVQATTDYYEEQFGPYFTPEYMEKMLNTNMLNVFHYEAYRNKETMDGVELSVEGSDDAENAYDFKAKVDVSTGETADVSGRVNTDENGNITRIHFIKIDPLMNAFDTAVKTDNGLFEYDHSKLETRASDEAYQPKYPTVMPFEVDGVSIDAGETGQEGALLTFMIHGEESQSMELTTVKDGDSPMDLGDAVEVSIGDQTARYDGVEGGVHRLVWTDGSITYSLKGKLDGLTKEKMITIAESFE